MVSGSKTKKVPAPPTWLQRALPRNSVQRVALVFVVLLGALLRLVMVSGDWAGWQTITEGTARAAAAVIGATGIDATLGGKVIHLSTRSLSIDPPCTGVSLFAVFVALVLAYPVSWKMRALAILAGGPVLFVANITRLVGVAWASELLQGRSFYVVHDYLFEFGMVFVVLAMWAAWLNLARRAS